MTIWLSHKYPGLNPCWPLYNHLFIPQTCLKYLLWHVPLACRSLRLSWLVRSLWLPTDLPPPLVNTNHYGSFPVTWDGAIVVMSSNCAYASQPYWFLSPNSHFLIILKLMMKGSLSDWFYLQDVSLTAKYRSITGTKGVGLIYWICNKSAITVFNCRNIFPIPLSCFTYL